MPPLRVRASLIRFVRPSRRSYVATSSRSTDLKFIFRRPENRQPSVAVRPTTYAISSDHASASVVSPANVHLHSSNGVRRTYCLPRCAAAARATRSSVFAVSPLAHPFPMRVSTHKVWRLCCHTNASNGDYLCDKTLARGLSGARSSRTSPRHSRSARAGR